MTDKDDEKQQTPEAAIEEVRRNLVHAANCLANQILTAFITGLVTGQAKCVSDIKAERKRGDDLEKRLAALEARMNQ